MDNRPDIAHWIGDAHNAPDAVILKLGASAPRIDGQNEAVVCVVLVLRHQFDAAVGIFPE
ncbi:MAG: hypothetical protein AAFY28_18330 [Actinomycetota bacterium]